jgi:hypothetical protein
MMMKKLLLLTGTALAVGCGSQTKHVGDDEPGPEDVVCEQAPEVIHETVDGSQPGGIEVVLTAEVITDQTEGCDTDVLVAELYYKQRTDEVFGTAVSMSTVDGLAYRGSIPGPAVGSSDMRYYFMVVDSEGAVTIDPPGANTKELKAYSFGVE